MRASERERKMESERERARVRECERESVPQIDDHILRVDRNKKEKNMKRKIIMSLSLFGKRQKWIKIDTDLMRNNNNKRKIAKTREGEKHGDVRKI